MDKTWRQKLEEWKAYRAKVYKMHVVDMLSFNEIAKIEGKTPQTINRLVQKAHRDKQNA